MSQVIDHGCATHSTEWPADFLDALRELAQQNGLDVAELLTTKSVVVGNTEFTLCHHGSLDPRGLTILADIGAVPDSEQLKIYRHLLESNIYLPPESGTYALHPDNGHVVLRMHLAFDEAPPRAAEIGDFLRQVAVAQARGSEAMAHAAPPVDPSAIPDRVSKV